MIGGGYSFAEKKRIDTNAATSSPPHFRSSKWGGLGGGGTAKFDCQRIRMSTHAVIIAQMFLFGEGETSGMRVVIHGGVDEIG
jgi:hypothetical protein